MNRHDKYAFFVVAIVAFAVAVVFVNWPIQLGEDAIATASIAAASYGLGLVYLLVFVGCALSQSRQSRLARWEWALVAGAMLLYALPLAQFVYQFYVSERITATIHCEFEWRGDELSTPMLEAHYDGGSTGTPLQKIGKQDGSEVSSGDVAVWGRSPTIIFLPHWRKGSAYAFPVTVSASDDGFQSEWIEPSAQGSAENSWQLQHVKPLREPGNCGNAPVRLRYSLKIFKAQHGS